MTQQNKIKVVIYGASGYGGVGLVENLLTHPHAEISALVSREGAGKPYTDLYPHLESRTDLLIEAAESFDPKGRGNFVFFSTPDGVSQGLVQEYLSLGYKIIDFSGDFRFNCTEDYKNYALWQKVSGQHQSPELLETSVYGCPEFHREQIKKAKLVGNPGCMAIGSLLALGPAVAEGLVDTKSLIVDAKTGISGAGKTPKAPFHFPSAESNAYAYKVGLHQHTFEIEKELTQMGKKETVVSFVPHVIPTSRGIICTAYAKLNDGVQEKDLNEAYDKHYRDEAFVLLEKSGSSPRLKDVCGANTCRVSYHIVERSRTLVAISAIDNLQKGQAGNAIQVMNIMMGRPETEGLEAPVRFP